MLKKTRFLIAGACAAMAFSGAAHAMPRQFNLPAQPLQGALRDFALQGSQQVVVKSDRVSGKQSLPVQGMMEPEEAMRQLLDGTGLTYKRANGAFVIAALRVAPTSFMAAAPVQETATAAPPAEPAVPAGEIVVTAQRRAESVQDVPVSMAVVTGEQLEKLNIKNIESVQLVTPGFVFNAGYTYAQNYVRGVGTDLPNIGLESAVGVYVDGVYLARAVGGVFDLVDSSSLQLLKGPQGTLYGRNATGGAILITTADPTDEFLLRATGEYGRFNFAMGEMVLNQPISDTFAVRLATRYSKEDGYIKNLGTSGDYGRREVFNLRGKARWNPTPDFTAVLALERSYQLDDTGAALQQRFPFPLCGLCGVPGVPPPPSGFYEIQTNQYTPQINKSNSASLRLTYDADSVEFSSLTSYRRDKVANVGIDQDYVPDNIFNYGLSVKSTTFQQDLQASTKFDGALNFLAGASYVRDKGTERAFLSGNSFDPVVDLFGELPIPQNILTTESYTVFGEAYVTPVDRLKITIGGRYSHDKRTLDASLNDAALAALAPPGSPQQFKQSASFGSFTPRVVVAYDLDIVNLYASYNKGFKAGGFATPAFAPINSVKPEKIESYEIGAKYVSPDRRLRMNLSAFLYNYSDVQRSVVGPGGVFIFQNAAKARGKGIEFDGQYQVNDWFGISGGAAYLHTKYLDFPGASISIPAPLPGGGLQPAFMDLTGYPLSRAPKWTAFISPNAQFDISDNWKARWNAVGRYTSAYDFAPGRGGPIGYHYQPRMFLVNMSAGIGPADEKYEIGMYINNLTNKKYYVQRGDTQGFFGIFDTVAKPITYGVRVTVKLD